MTGHKVSLLVSFVIAPILIAMFAVGYFLLRYNNIAFVGGPTRSQVVQGAQELVNKTMTKVNPPITHGKTIPTFAPCGHGGEGVGPVNYVGALNVFISGVDPKNHNKIDEQIQSQGDSVIPSISPKGEWSISVIWDSPTSTTGMINASLGCTEIAN